MQVAFHRVTTLLLLSVSCLATGCEKPIAVSGTVLFDGEPLPEGSIRFFPDRGTPGGGGSAKVLDGKYDIPADANLLAGSYSVMIVAMKETGRMLRAPEAIPVSEGGTGKREKYKEIIQYIPGKYNSGTKLRVQLKESSNRADFSLSRS
jgi:hypothetical protein